MANGRNRDFMMVSLAVSSVPLAFVLYFIAVDRRWSAIIAFVVFLIVLVLCTCAFLSWKTIKLTIPVLLSVLRACSYVLSPMASVVQGIPLVGKAVNGVIKLTFWVWFVILMMSDVLVRKFLKGFVGLHEPSAGQYSAVNACDTNFQPCGEFGKVLDQHKVQRIEDGGQDFERDHDEKAIALMNQKSKDLAALRDGGTGGQQADYSTTGPQHHHHHHHRRAGLTLKPRPKSMDYGKYRTPGRAGSDLASMTNEEWMALLQSADIDASRFADRETTGGKGAGARAYAAATGYSPSPAESRHGRHSSISSNASSTLGSLVLEHDAATGANTTTSTTATAPRPPRYSQPIATTLAMVSKLVYEDVPIIRHELELSGYDLHTFRAIAYKNTRGFIVQKGRNIILVFRGTDPLNLQNAWTDLQARFVAFQTKDETPVSLGKCHSGMYYALGTDDFLLPSEELSQQQPGWHSAPFTPVAGMGTDQDRHALQHYSSKSSMVSSFSSPQRTTPSTVSSFRSEASRTPNTIHLELSNQSIYQTISTSLQASYTLIKFLLRGLFTHVSDPVDHRFAGEVRDLGAFGQACRWVDGLRLEHEEKMHQQNMRLQRSQTIGGRGNEAMSRLSGVYAAGQHRDPMDYYAESGNLEGRQVSNKHHHRRRSSSMGGFPSPSGNTSRNATQEIGSWRGIEGALQEYQRDYQDASSVGGKKKKKQKKLRFFIAGHSLGGGLATLFVAKMVQTKSPLLNIFSGLYTYGNPKIGDKDFSRAFGYSLASKMFHHVHNNDIISRLPFWGSYATPPGTLVFIDTSRKLSLYPPDRETLMPVPVRGISFLHMSGIFNIRVIMRMRRESWLRILERFLLPFFMNDHFPCDYVKALAEGQVEVVLEDSARFGGVDEKETGSPLQTGYFSFLGRRNVGHHYPIGQPGSTVPAAAAAAAAKGPAVASSPLPSVATGSGGPSTIGGGGGGGNSGGRGLGIRMMSQDLDSDSGIGGDLPEDYQGAQHRRRIVKYPLPSSSLKDEEPMETEKYNQSRSGHRQLNGSREGHTHWRRLADGDDDVDGEEEEGEGEGDGRPPVHGLGTSSSMRGRHGSSLYRRRSRSSSQSRSRSGSLHRMDSTGRSMSTFTTTTTTTTMTTMNTARNGSSAQFYASSPSARRRSRSRRRSTVSSANGFGYY